jgi:RNA polymerase sigma-70 factor, ECF subfamily
MAAPPCGSAFFGVDKAGATMLEHAHIALTFTGWVSELARAHTPALAAVARAEGLVAQDALDAVQEAFETFLKLPQARSLVGEPEDSRALMSVIVRNAARNMRRKHHRARPHSDVTDDSALTDPLPTVDELLQSAEEHTQMMGCVTRLGDVQRRVVTLRMLEEASGSEVASALELTQANVAVLLHRAKKELLVCMTS